MSVSKYAEIDGRPRGVFAECYARLETAGFRREKLGRKTKKKKKNAPIVLLSPKVTSSVIYIKLSVNPWRFGLSTRRIDRPLSPLCDSYKNRDRTGIKCRESGLLYRWMWITIPIDRNDCKQSRRLRCEFSLRATGRTPDASDSSAPSISGGSESDGTDGPSSSSGESRDEQSADSSGCEISVTPPRPWESGTMSVPSPARILKERWRES